MKTWIVPVEWTMRALVKIKADTLEQAIDEALTIPLPENGYYVDDSFQIGEDSTEDIQNFYN